MLSHATQSDQSPSPQLSTHSAKELLLVSVSVKETSGFGVNLFKFK